MGRVASESSPVTGASPCIGGVVRGAPAVGAAAAAAAGPNSSSDGRLQGDGCRNSPPRAKVLRSQSPLSVSPPVILSTGGAGRGARDAERGSTYALHQPAVAAALPVSRSVRDVAVSGGDSEGAEGAGREDETADGPYNARHVEKQTPVRPSMLAQGARFVGRDMLGEGRGHAISTMWSREDSEMARAGERSPAWGGAGNEEAAMSPWQAANFDYFPPPLLSTAWRKVESDRAAQLVRDEAQVWRHAESGGGGVGGGGSHAAEGGKGVLGWKDFQTCVVPALFGIRTPLWIHAFRETCC